MDRDLILAIERAAVRAMPPAETVRVGEWSVAIGRGAVGRLNACTTFGSSPRRRMFELIETVERRYAARGRPARFRLTPLDHHLDERLETRGYRRDREAIVLSGPAGGQLDPDVEVASAAGPTWLRRFTEWGGHDDLRVSEIAESLGSLTLELGVFTAEAAVGAVVLDRPWAGIFDLAVDPERRRLGHGSRLVTAMSAWSAARGCDRLYLQVAATNDAAADLYQALGMEEVYRYWYRVLG